MQEKYYPTDHPDIASSLNSIGAIYEQLNKEKIALDYYRRALTINEKYFPVGHKFRVKNKASIRRLCSQK